MVRNDLSAELVGLACELSRGVEIAKEHTGLANGQYRGSAAIASVCTGGLILAATGLLDGRRATTKRAVTGAEQSPLQVMRMRHADVDVVEARLVDDGSIVTGGGVALAIDVTLHLVERFYGFAVADETARIIEYRTAWRANKASFEAIVEKSDAR
jgi:transcriptional regulator GlxA family with amidase domain